MSELPREARELLELAREGHEPASADARSRVRRGVAVAVAASAGAAVSGKAIAAGTKAGLFASTGAKLATLGSAIVLASAVVVGTPLLRPSEPAGRAAVAPRRAHKAPAPVAAVTPEASAPVAPVAPEASAPAAPVAPQLVEPEVELEVPAAVETKPRAARPARRERAPKATNDALRAEMALLRAASDALTAGQVERAIERLKEHEREFARGQLGEEREGLRAIARCLREERGARAAARRYLARHPESVLAVRAIGACKLENER